MYDIIVIGGGVIGGCVLRELSKHRLHICLLEKDDDVATGQSRANSGIVHAGFDAAEGTLKARFNVEGSKMMPDYCKELGVRYKNNGSLVLAFSKEDTKTLSLLKARGEKNGVEGLQILDQKQLRTLEPNVSECALGALYAPTGGIVCPYGLTIAAVGNAMDNGAELKTNFFVTAVTRDKDGFTVTAEDGREVKAKILINCAGLGSGKIAALAGDDSVKIFPRKGEYILLDRESGDYVHHTVFTAPTKLGKGVLVSQTVDGNIIVGPTAEEKDGTETSASGLDLVTKKAKEMYPDLPFFNTITSFAGVRAYSDKHDFIIEESKKVKNLINVAGIESPGLTSAPAIAKYVVQDIVGKLLPLSRKEDFNGTRTSEHFFEEFSVEEKNELIKREPAYGKIVCRCERITEGEILHAIRANPPAKSVDAVKRRTRAGMGRCQGGFCQPHVAELIAGELEIPFEEVTKSGKGSELVLGVTK